MNPRAIWLLRIAGLVVFATIMWTIGAATNWTLRAIPFSLATLIVGAVGGFIAGTLFGFRDAEKHYKVDQRGN